MKYENAKDLLPPQLLRQVQKYAAGKTLYIPSMGHASWGEVTGYRRYLAQRNRDIRAAFRQGASQDALAEQYCLSTDSIRKIIYSKKEEPILDYNCSLSCACSYAKEVYYSISFSVCQVVSMHFHLDKAGEKRYNERKGWKRMR